VAVPPAAVRAPRSFTRTFPGEAAQTTSAFTHQLTDDCHLRTLEESDAEELHALIEASRDYLSDWMPWAADQTLHGTLQFIRMTRRQLADNNGFQAAIVCRGEIVGVAGFHAIDWANRATSIGYWLGEQHQGKGTMTRAVRALINHAFSVWELNRVEIRAAPHNVRSRAVAERLGFVEEGTLSQAERIGDRYLDNVVYAMLASGWSG
jgi:ribosomal-protein-serine acetyltransferase